MSEWEADERIAWLIWMLRNWGRETPVSGDDMARTRKALNMHVGYLTAWSICYRGGVEL